MMISATITRYSLSLKAAFSRFLGAMGVNNLLVASLHEDKPTVVPTTGAGGISDDQRLRFVKAL